MTLANYKKVTKDDNATTAKDLFNLFRFKNGLSVKKASEILGIKITTAQRIANGKLQIAPMPALTKLFDATDGYTELEFLEQFNN